ncbi:hypothetical protein TNIN_252491 [Trichonephila inaurata madagascariensis]|uniref:Uncharacterized protein n=1 Tax=Trichonephila inaurata madagascariensis TaxID=2747483 RepID=A0A8X6IAH6_9ARAC|nr:hypothetical protein TNIN_252491 [Trichonephila inaurata madagascariensis]
MDLTTDQPNVMELSLPSSTDSTWAGTPTVTNCERLHDITTDIKKFGIVIENIQSTIRALHLNGINDDNDPTLMDQNRRLQEYQRLQHLSIVRPNVSYAQAANNSAPSNTSNSKQQTTDGATSVKGNPYQKHQLRPERPFYLLLIGTANRDLTHSSHNCQSYCTISTPGLSSSHAVPAVKTPDVTSFPPPPLRYYDFQPAANQEV